jgi:DNA-binding Lrp family transcriptional regulator
MTIWKILNSILKKGTKVRPIAKTAGLLGLSSSNIWKRAQELGQSYLYVMEDPLAGAENSICCGITSRGEAGDYFKLEDLIVLTDEQGQREANNQTLKYISARLGDISDILREISKTLEEDKWS